MHVIDLDLAKTQDLIDPTDREKQNVESLYVAFFFRVVTMS
jgi:hypothetical protein